MNKATTNGTLRFKGRFDLADDFYAKVEDLYLSSIGVGTYAPEAYKDENYEYIYKKAVIKAIELGVNVIDTASNYRYTQSEKEIGAALQEVFERKIASRDEIVICTKGGFIQLEYPFPKNPYSWIKDNMIKPGLANESDIALDQHCLSPEYLEWSFEQSLNNMGLKAIDIYYLHNIEMQFGSMPTEEIYEKTSKTFEILEHKIKDGKLSYYGLACWNGLLNDASNAEFISLEKIASMAKGGFKFLQVPFNLAKTHAYSVQNQEINGELYSLFEAANILGLNVITSSSFLQTNLFKRPFNAKVAEMLGAQFSDFQKALRFCAASPSVCSLFGSKDPAHVESNLEIAKHNKTTQFKALFSI